MKKSKVINVVYLKKGKSTRRIVFYEDEFGITATIQCNSELFIYSVSEELANREIIDLVHKGYKVL